MNMLTGSLHDTEIVRFFAVKVSFQLHRYRISHVLAEYALFLYKNLLYKKVEAEIDPDVKNMLTRSNSMNLYRVKFSLSKYSEYVYNSFKLKFAAVRLLSPCCSQLWKNNK